MEKNIVKALDEFARSSTYENFEELGRCRGEDSDSISELKLLAIIAYNHGVKDEKERIWRAYVDFMIETDGVMEIVHIRDEDEIEGFMRYHCGHQRNEDNNLGLYNEV